MNSRKGISLMVMVITIVVMIIIAGAVFLTLSNQKLDESANLAVLQSDMQLMLDGYEVKYNELLVKYKGDSSKFSSEDIEELQTVIPDKYKNDYMATTSGIKYVGTNEEEKKIAEQMGIYITDVIVAVKNLDIETTTHTADITINLKDGDSFDLVSEYKYYIKGENDNSWVLKEASDSPVISITKLVYGKYDLKIELITSDDSSIEYISPNGFELKPIEIGSIKFTYDSKTGTEYTPDTWANTSIYCSLTQGNTNTTYEIEDVLNATKEDYLLENEGTYTVTVDTNDGTNFKNIKHVIHIDKTKPVLTKMEVISPEDGVYKEGQDVVIKTSFSENIYGTKGNKHRDVITSANAPMLQVKFGNGEAKNAQFYNATNNTISYKYTIKSDDNGELAISNYTGKVYDIANNETEVEAIELTGKNVIADNAGPSYSSVEVKNITTTGYDVYVYGVKDTYSDVSKLQFPTWTSNGNNNGQDDIQSNWQASDIASGTLQEDGTTWVYRVNRTDHNNEFGIYNTHVYLYDTLGNTTIYSINNINVPGTVTFEQSPIETNPTSINIYNGSEYGDLPQLTRVGYDFGGWYKDEGLTTQVTETTKVTDILDHTLYQKWIPRTDTKYTVIHEQMNLDGTTYTEKERQELTGITDTKVTPSVNEYEGFIAPETQTVTIAADGSTVVIYRYKRDRYKVIVRSGPSGIASVTGTGRYFYGEKVNISAVESEGYDFMEWVVDEPNIELEDENQSDTSFVVPVISGSAANLIAIGRPIVYKVVYNANGGTGSMEKSSHTYDEAKELNENTFTKIGYKFIGWSTTENGDKVYNDKESVINLSSILSDTVHLYAVWEKSTSQYTVVHELMNIDGKTYTTKDTETIDSTTGESVTPAVNTYEGFTAPATQTVTVAADGSTTVTYKYTRNQHKVIVKAGTGISSVTGAGTYYYGASVTINATVSTGYTWSKWTGTHNTATQNYTFTMPDTEVGDTANATVNTYTITYNLDGGTLPTGKTNPTSYNVTTESFELIEPTKTGYTFTGWTGTGLSTATKPVVVAKGSTGNRAYTATWTANTYTVSYNGNGATGGSTASSSHTYGVAKALTTNGYTRAYTVTYNYNGATGGNATTSVTATYSFNKWNTAANGTGTAYTNGQNVSNLTSANGGTVTLFAQWTSTAVTLPTPTKTGYTFGGWYSDSALTKSVGAGGASYTPTSSLTLYAKWTANTYTVTYYNGTTKLGTSSHAYGTASALKTWATLGGTVSNSSVGWGFYGWSTSNANTTKTYTNGQNVSTLTSTNGGNINVYAVYSRTITFKHGFSSATSSTATQLWNPYGSTNGTHLSGVTSPTLTSISGWTVNGFRNDTTAGASEYAQKSTIYPASGEAATLYGVYSKTVTATYYYYNGTAYTNTKPTATVYYNSYGNTLGGTPTAPTVSNPSGWSPRGWSTSSALNATVATPGAITANTTYYYSWSKTVTISYDMNGGTGTIASQSGTAYRNYAGTDTNPSITLSSTEPTKANYVFSGWNTSSDGTGTSYSGGTAYTFSESTKLYVKWVDAVAQIATTSGTTYYATVNDAVAAASSGQTVTLLKTSTVTDTITVSSGKVVYLQTNNMTIMTTMTTYLFDVQGTLYINGSGTIQNTTTATGGTIFKVTGMLNLRGSGYIWSARSNVIESSGTVNISGGYIANKVPATATGNQYPTIVSTGTLNIAGGTIDSGTVNTIQSTGGTVNITGGTITNSASYATDSVNRAIYLENTTATIGAATITSTNNIAIHSVNSNITVNSGANITGDYRGINKNGGGTLTINSGATVTTESSSYLSNSASFTSAAIFSSSTDSGNIYVKGGKIYALAKSGTGISGIVINNGSNTLYLGIDDSTLSTMDPDIIGYSASIARNSTNPKVYWYDGRMARIAATTNSLTSFINSTTNLTYKSSLTPAYSTGTLTSVNGTEYLGSYVYLKSKY